MKNQLKALIVEDHIHVQKGIIETFNNYFLGIKYVITSSPKEAKIHLSKAKFDLVIIDLEYKNGENGLHLLEYVKEHFSTIRCIVYSGYKTIQIINKIIQYRANSYICKDADEKDFVQTVNEVLETPVNRFYRSSCFITNTESQVDIENKFFTSSVELVELLSNREKEVVKEISKNPNKLNKAIAQDLFISDKTLKTHLKNIYKKLKVNTKEKLSLFIFD